MFRKKKVVVREIDRKHIFDSLVVCKWNKVWCDWICQSLLNKKCNQKL